MYFNIARFRIVAIAVKLLICGHVLSYSFTNSNYFCDLGKYRSLDGSCNNLQNSQWGVANSAFLRLLPPIKDEFLERLPPIDVVTTEILHHLQPVSAETRLPRNGIFQLWTEILSMDLNLPSNISETENEATAYLDGSFLYHPSSRTVQKSMSGDLIYDPRQNCSEKMLAKMAVLLLISEHNRIADLLRRKNVRSNAETIFEESKRILIAEIQHITYTQYIPLLLGDIINTADEDEDKMTIPDYYESETEVGIYYSTRDIIFSLLRDFNFEGDEDVEQNKLENLLRGFLVRESSNFHYFRSEGSIKKILQLSRKHKIKPYEEWRQFCLNNKNVNIYSSHLTENQNFVKLRYNKSSDIELLAGGLYENKIENGLFGPTLGCIALLQFGTIRKGDRFWYTNRNLSTSFNPAELKELKKVTIADLLCSNIKGMEEIQKNAFLLYDTELNPSGPCSKNTFSVFSFSNKKRILRKMLNERILKDAVRKAELDVDRRQQIEYLLWSNKGGVDPKSPTGTAAAFSKPNRDALLMANNSILFEYASNEIFSILNHRSSRRRKRQLFDSDDTIISLTDDLDGNYLQNIDISGMLPNFLNDPNENCPPEVGACDPNYPYRSISGYCNNLRKPSYGKSISTFIRMLPPAYENGISKPRLHSIVNREISLPSARLVSSMMHLDISHLDRRHSMMLMQFAQFLDHDITFTPVHRGFFASIPDCRPCDSSHTVHPECMPIEVPPGDPFYPQVNYTIGKLFCLPFMRSLPGQQRLGPREQINQNSAYLDASQVYGDTSCLARKLRSYYSGKLNSTVSLYGDKDLLPQSPVHPECRASSGYCFIAGDGRASEQPGLTSIHTIFMREHNRIAEELRALNPRWKDEKLYQRTRKILNAEYQHIVYNEFLPRLLGLNAMNLYGISLEPPGQYFNGYSEECNPAAFSEFASAAFRIGHSLLRPFVPRMSPAYQNIEPPILLRDTFFNPDIIYERYMVDEIVRGLYTTPVEELDQFITKEITNHLFEDKKIPHSGFDLIALNIQRGRDHGIPSYNDYRAKCNMKRATTWEDFSRELPADVIARLRRIYPNVDDVDLFPAGISEHPIPGGMVGPTFACIIGLQFRQLRNCDRFWYETSNPLMKFTPDQLMEIRKSSLAKILCENMDVLVPIQRYVMDLPDDRNIRMPCHSLPHINLNAWKDQKRFCQFRGLILEVGESYLPSPCTSCICTPQEMKCATIRVTSCIKLIQEVGEAAVLGDGICAIQCSLYITSNGNNVPLGEHAPVTPNQSRGINFYLAGGLKPPRPFTPRRKAPTRRNFKIPDFSI